jgi:TonB family protein
MLQRKREVVSSEVVSSEVVRREAVSSLIHYRRRLLLPLGLLVTSLVLSANVLSVTPLAAQTSDQSSSERKVITRVEPEYPDALKRLYIGGVVRVEVVVASNGAVKSTKLLGGSPILGQSTMKAVKQWRYASGAEETLTVKLEFDPHR